jgi:hypothetical protein
MTEAYRSRLTLHGVRFGGVAGKDSRCDLEVIQLRRGEALVVCSERPDNPGTSVTDFAAELATSVCDRRGIAPDLLIWVERQPERNGPGGKLLPEFYKLVTFAFEQNGGTWRFVCPRWREMTGDDWCELGLTPRG